MDDPGALFANVPGTLGFYPAESAIILCFSLVDEAMSRYQLDQVIRLDIEDTAHLKIVAEIQSDLLLSLIVTQKSPAAEQTMKVVKALTSLTVPRIEAIWHTSSITEGEPLILLSGKQALSSKNRWAFGVVPSIFQAPATQESLYRGQIIDLTRAEATSRFDRVILSNFHQDSLVEAVNCRLHSLGNIDFPVRTVVQSMIAELQDILESAKGPKEINRFRIGDLALVLALFDKSVLDLRDLAIWEIVERPAVGGILALTVAQHAASDHARANALCAYFLATHKTGATSRAYLALKTANETAPEHFLTRLLLVAHSRGETNNIFKVIKKGVDISRVKYGIE